jgi:hypothetical protein
LDEKAILERIAPTAVDHSVPGNVAASCSLPNACEATSAESHADTDADSSSSASKHRAQETWPPKKELSIMVGTADSQGSGGTNVAEQLDFLGDTMLAEVELAWAAEGRGDAGFYGVTRLGADGFGAHELPQLPNLDILSERCSLELTEGFGS